jgi:uncharacterized metal-binding protein YceD (DUF177 family)
MKHLNDFLIPFIGLKLGKHQFDYQINNKFFENFDFDEYESSDVKVNLIFEKKSTFMELNFKHKGTVNVACDLTGEMFDLPIKGKIKLVVQFGEEYNNDNDELLIIPHGEHQLDVSQYLYEMIVLSVPLRRVHPGIKDGTLQSVALEKLNELKVKGLSSSEKPDKTKKENKTEENTDPRWDKLKQLLTDK